MYIGSLFSGYLNLALQMLSNTFTGLLVVDYLYQRFWTCGPWTYAWWFASKGYFLLFKDITHKLANFSWHSFQWWSATERQNL